MNPNLTEDYRSQVLFDGLSISIIQAQRSTEERKSMAYVGTPMVDGIFGSLSKTFFCCFGKKLVLKVWANSLPCLKKSFIPFTFPLYGLLGHHCVDGVALMATFQNPVTSVSQSLS